MDHTIWKPDPTEIADRLGWLSLPGKMREHLGHLREFAESCAGFERIVLMGMGGSSLAPEVLATTFGGKKLTALDTTHPEAVLATEEAKAVPTWDSRNGKPKSAHPGRREQQQ